MEAFFVSQAAIEICATLEQKQHKVNQQKGEKKRLQKAKQLLP